MTTKLRAAAFVLAVAVSVGMLTPRTASAQDESAGAELSPDSLRALIAAAVQGHTAAQFDLGQMYDFGWGVPVDYVEAVRWYHAAAEQGHARAQYLLGRLHEFGHGVPENAAEAVRWYRAAAEQGYARAPIPTRPDVRIRPRHPRERR